MPPARRCPRTPPPEPDDRRSVVLRYRITVCPPPTGGTVALGRAPGCEIAISPLHARLTCDRLAIEHLGSTASTVLAPSRRVLAEDVLRCPCRGLTPSAADSFGIRRTDEPGIEQRELLVGQHHLGVRA